jgi:glycosyltransferase involved in cell wall biosynthesis
MDRFEMSVNHNKRSHNFIRTCENIALNNLKDFNDDSNISQESKDLCSKLSLCTTTKDRNSFLEKSLSTWIHFPFDEILIVDWSSTEPVLDVLKKYNDPRIKLIRVNGEESYRHSAGRNFKVKMCKNEWVLSIDSDVMLTPQFGKDIILNDSIFHTINTDISCASGIGTCVFSKTQFNSVRGCNEEMNGWGFEDLDLYLRMREQFKNKFYSYDTIYHQPHDNTLRTKNTEFRDKWISNGHNMHIATKYQKNDHPVEEITNFEIIQIKH